MVFLPLLVLGATLAAWTGPLSKLASDKGYEPFKTIHFRARLSSFYAEVAPDKASEVTSLAAKNLGQEERLYKRLEAKYKSPVQEPDTLSVLGAMVSTAQDAAAQRLPSAVLEALSAASGTWGMLPAPHKLALIAIQSTTLASGFFLSSNAPRDKTPAFLLWFTALTLAAFRPLPELTECTPSFLAAAGREWWSSLDPQREGLFLCTVLALLAAVLRRPGQRRIVLLVWLAAALALTNPSDHSEKEAASAVSAAPAALLKALPKGALKLTDLGLFSVLTWSRASNHSWRSPAIAVGAGGRWAGFVTASSDDVGLTMSGRPLPAWAFPSALFAAFWALLQVPF
jgi:hypothetical protein